MVKNTRWLGKPVCSSTIAKKISAAEDLDIASGLKIAYFVTPHGFGHAARAAAVMLALRRRLPQTEFDIFTTVPRWFFQESLGEDFTYHNFASDIGLVQTSPFSEDLPATAAALDQAYKNSHSQITLAASLLSDQNCQLVVCDIAPLGIQAAQAAGLPATLVENFTWDFIYSGYNEIEPGFNPHIQRLKQISTQVELHIQTEPVCQLDPKAYQVAPISRPPRTTREETREYLGLKAKEPVILVTLGGIEEEFSARAALKKHSPCVFVLPGSAEQLTHDENLILLPHHNDFYHPDLVRASDAVIGKLGYSTVAEVYHSGLPFAYIPRPTFPETPTMAEFARREMGAMELASEDFLKGRWGDLPEQLLAAPRREPPTVNGADQAAAILLEKYG